MVGKTVAYFRACYLWTILQTSHRRGIMAFYLINNFSIFICSQFEDWNLFDLISILFFHWVSIKPIVFINGKWSTFTTWHHGFCFLPNKRYVYKMTYSYICKTNYYPAKLIIYNFLRKSLPHTWYIVMVL